MLSWLSKGKTNRDIAQILGLSPRTVDKHLKPTVNYSLAPLWRAEGRGEGLTPRIRTRE